MIDNFGDVISNARKEKKLTLREAAKQIGISHPYLSQLEKNKNKKPSLEILYKIAYELNISFAYLILLSEIDIGYTANQFTKEALEFIKERKNNDFQMQQEFPHDLNVKENPLIALDTFNYLETAEELKESIRQNLLKGALKNLSNYKLEEENSFKNPLLKNFQDSGGTVNHKITFDIPAYKSSTIDGITFTTYIPPDEAKENFFNIEHLLELNFDLLHYRGKKITREQKERLLQSLKSIMEEK
ncbi:helix-turn-helix domain-containing protein [Lysinibacillus piscis]|uniref:HTH cro/C1-type domain-containing protein n=1 Tax=Lysinibacillus piscis TaxID=2518931 RepID=A0ABQ5NIS7_9BACI|nr:helix-turn-helix transcriptional regulator [Lysinibacillus sp. KH24]GLC88217.1 hypothetical protein LYSBPC_13440 [Lysinibacillus sp. KH24]